MSDLQTKFTTLEGQISANHTEIMAALNTIAFALGAPPTTPNTSLADVVTVLETINSNIVGMRAANALYYASALGALDTISLNTETMINNNSLNAQRMIQAIYATFCECATTTPLLPLPIDTTPSPLPIDEKCRRVQFYLAVFSTWLTSIANYGSSGASITGSVLEGLLVSAGVAFGMTATGAEIGAAGGIPGVVVGAIVGAIVAAVYTFGGSILVDYANQFASATVQDALRQGLYSAENADEGQSIFQDIIASNFETIPAGIINFLWWSAWSNDLYSGTPAVDDSMFDSTICAPPDADGCITINSTVVMFGTDGNASAIVWPSPLVAINQTPAGYTASAAVWCESNLIGYTITPSMDINFFHHWNQPATVITANTIFTVGADTDLAAIHIYPSTVPFSIELCEPA